MILTNTKYSYILLPTLQGAISNLFFRSTYMFLFVDCSRILANLSLKGTWPVYIIYHYQCLTYSQVNSILSGSPNTIYYEVSFELVIVREKLNAPITNKITIHLLEQWVSPCSIIYNVFQAVAVMVTGFWVLKKPAAFIVYTRYKNGFFTFVTFRHFRFRYLYTIHNLIKINYNYIFLWCPKQFIQIVDTHLIKILFLFLIRFYYNILLRYVYVCVCILILQIRYSCNLYTNLIFFIIILNSKIKTIYFRGIL